MSLQVAGQSVSVRSEAVSHALSRIASGYLEAIDYYRRREQPGVLDFTFGDPREMPSEAYVSALRSALTPQHGGWFAYTMYDPAAQEAAAASLGRLTGLPFAPDDILLTTGGFAALSLGLKAVADPGDEIIYSLPPWFSYEALIVEAALVPIKVSIDLETFDLDIDAIAAAITPRTRVVIVNSPNNPTGRVYSAETLTRLATVLEEASARNGRRIFLLSDEPYNRIVFDGGRFRTPAEFYAHTLVAYSYGKTLLAPGQRIGYLALPPALPDREALRRAVQALQVAVGWAFPNAVMQYAVPELEQQAFDVARLERRRDHMVDALTAMGYRIHRPEGTFYLFPRSPIPDDEVFARLLAEQQILVMPGAMFETPGFFRICLTATEETCERSLPGFAAALTQAVATVL
jgi:aspartate aminotransferase